MRQVRGPPDPWVGATVWESRKTTTQIFTTIRLTSLRVRYTRLQQQASTLMLGNAEPVAPSIRSLTTAMLERLKTQSLFIQDTSISMTTKVKSSKVTRSRDCANGTTRTAPRRGSRCALETTRHSTQDKNGMLSIPWTLHDRDAFLLVATSVAGQARWTAYDWLQQQER